MAITLQAIELTDQRTLRETREGWQGKRVFIVSTGMVDVAVFGNGQGQALGLPVKGDSWHDVDAPYLVVTGRDFKRDGGTDTDPVNKTGGWTRVEVTYETLGLHGRLPPPSSGISFTRLSPTVTGVQAIYGIDPDTGQVPAGAIQIADGQGVPKDVGLVAYEVFVPLSVAAFGLLDIPRLVSLHRAQATNQDAVTLPKYLSAQRADAFTQGQLRFTGFAVDDPDETGYRYLRVSLAAAPDHLAYWSSQDAGGDAATEHAEHVYQRMAFAGLW